MQIDYPTYWSAAIHPSQITSWFVNSKPGRRSNYNINDLPGFPAETSRVPENLKKNAHNGVLSKMAVKKIRRAIDYTVYLSKPMTRKIDHRNKRYDFTLNFITCTLSSTQIHSDLEIKKHIFQPLLNYFRQHYHVKNYVWVIEKQKNGNTHFHIVTDRWIPHNELRNKWNEYQQSLGYVTRYGLAQRAWHADGFRVRPELLKKWSFSQQYTAWLSGCRSDWTNPNSTDVHSLINIGNVRCYITKYVTKNQAKDIKTTAFTPHNIESVLDETEYYKTITGRIWGCNEELSNVQGAFMEYDCDFPAEMQALSNDKSVFKVIKPYFSVFYISIDQLRAKGYLTLVNLFEKFCIQNFPSYIPQLKI
jgi:hypothetical protein